MKPRKAIRGDGAVLHVDVDVDVADVDVACACAAMLAKDAVGSLVIRRDGDVLHVDVNIDIIGSVAPDPLVGCRRIVAYFRLGLRLSDSDAEPGGQQQGDGAHTACAHTLALTCTL